MKHRIGRDEKPRIIAYVMLVVTLSLSPVVITAPAYAIDATDGSGYAQSLVNDGDNDKEGHVNVMDKREWISETIQNPEATGYEDLGSFQTFLDNAQTAFRGIFIAFLGTIVALFIAKMIGRAIYDTMLRNDEEAEVIPMFFLTSKERSARKEPTVMKVRGGLFGSTASSGDGKMPGQRDYSGPSHISDHPYAQFCKEFVFYLGIALGVFLLIEVMLGLASAFFTATAQGGGSDVLQRHAMFGTSG